jgi:hypothetical protein
MNQLFSRTFRGASNFAAYTLIGQGSTPGTCVQSVSAARDFIGVVAPEGSSANLIPVQIVGVAKVRAGAAVTAGNKITSDAAGEGIPITLAAAAANVRQVCGTALTSAADGELFDMLIQPMLTTAA